MTALLFWAIVIGSLCLFYGAGSLVNRYRERRRITRRLRTLRRY